MNVLAPELSALMTILRSVGPVISTLSFSFCLLLCDHAPGLRNECEGTRQLTDGLQDPERAGRTPMRANRALLWSREGRRGVCPDMVNIPLKLGEQDHLAACHLSRKGQSAPICYRLDASTLSHPRGTSAETRKAARIKEDRLRFIEQNLPHPAPFAPFSYSPTIAAWSLRTSCAGWREIRSRRSRGCVPRL